MITVAELIAELQKYDPGLQICFFTSPRIYYEPASVIPIKKDDGYQRICIGPFGYNNQVLEDFGIEEE